MLLLLTITQCCSQVLELQDMYKQQGPETFEAMKPPQLTWDQVSVMLSPAQPRTIALMLCAVMHSEAPDAPQEVQVRALKPGAVGLGMGGVAPGEILPSEDQTLRIEAAPTAKPLLLTNDDDAGEASDRGQSADGLLGSRSTAEDSATRQAQVKQSAAAAAVAASMSQDRVADNAASVEEHLSAAAPMAGEGKPSP